MTYTGKENTVFAGRADHHDLILFTQPVFQFSFGTQRSQAPEIICLPDFDAFVVDDQEAWLSGFSGYDDHVISSMFESRSEVASHVGVSVTTCCRRFAAEVGFSR